MNHILCWTRAGVLLACLATTRAMAAPVETVLHDFAGGTDGAFTNNKLTIDSAGNLYGTTVEGGAPGFGVAFELSPPKAGSTAWTETILHTFAGGNDGSVPNPLTLYQGHLFGTTYSGGKFNNGTIFELSPPTGTQTTWTERVLYSFTGGADGGSPTASPTVGKNGVLYGTAVYGGVAGVNNKTSGNGVVYSLTPPAAGTTAWARKILYFFKGSNGLTGDGTGPYSSVIIDSSGALYGTTEDGGAVGNTVACQYGYTGCGTAYRLNPPASGNPNWSETVLWRFGVVEFDGAIPYAGLTFGPGGVLYGATADGGGDPPTYGSLNLGTVFQLTPPASGQTAWTEKVLHDFGFDYDYAYPTGDLVVDKNGALYGTALAYGSSTPVGQSGAGGVFKLSPPASGSTVWTETRLHNFTDSSGDFCLTGCYPEAGLVMNAAGTLFGTTYEGGTFPEASDNVSPGVVFQLTQ